MKKLCECSEESKYVASGEGYFYCTGCGNGISIDRAYEAAFFSKGIPAIKGIHEIKKPLFIDGEQALRCSGHFSVNYAELEKIAISFLIDTTAAIDRAVGRIKCGLLGEDQECVDHYDGILWDGIDELRKVLDSIEGSDYYNPNFKGVANEKANS